MEIKANNILSICQRIDHTVPPEPGQIKTAIEYQTSHGTATSFYFTVLSDDVYQCAELQEAGVLETIKFKQSEDGWHLMFGFQDKEKNFTVDMEETELQSLLEQQHIELAK